VCVCVCVCLRVCVCVCCAHVCVCVCVYVCDGEIRGRMGILTHTLFTHRHTHVRARAHTHSRTLSLIYTHPHTNTHARTLTHTPHTLAHKCTTLRHFPTVTNAAVESLTSPRTWKPRRTAQHRHNASHDATATQYAGMRAKHTYSAIYPLTQLEQPHCRDCQSHLHHPAQPSLIPHMSR